MRRLASLTTLALVASAVAAPTRATAATATLYDPAAGSLPTAQGWTFLTDPLFVAKAKQTFTSGLAVLDSTATTTDKAGWFSNLSPFPKHPRQPALDARSGILFSFAARLDAESHPRPERAGFSVIVTDANLLSIELGFWTDQVWAQSGPDFLHAETSVFATTNAVVHYDLVLLGERYRLSADGQPILEGPLRRYASFGAPYNIPEFLFLGDDTTSAAAKAAVGRVAVGDLPRIRVTRDGATVKLCVTAETGRTILFEGSTDFAQWTPLGTAVNDGSDALLTVPVDAEGAPRFFRASLR